MTENICTNCGKENAQFLSAGQHYCDMNCARDSQNVTKPINNSASSFLSAQEIQTVEASQNELLNEIESRIDTTIPELVIEKTHEQLIMHLQSIERQKQELQARARITHARINKLLQLGEGQRVERYRKLGVNSDTEVKAKVHGEIQKLIVRYRKEGWKEENIYNLLLNDMEFEEIKINEALKALPLEQND